MLTLALISVDIVGSSLKQLQKEANSLMDLTFFLAGDALVLSHYQLRSSVDGHYVVYFGSNVF